MNQYKEIVVALIAVLGAAIPYFLQKNKELNLRTAEKKREAYTAFLRNFTEIAVAVINDEEVTGKNADRDRMLARDQLLLFGSDEVIMAYDAWIKYSDQEEHSLDKEGELVSLMLLAIRKDILGKTDVTIKQIDSLNPFNRG